MRRRLWRLRGLWWVWLMSTETDNIYPTERYVPRALLLQWHVTERCNLRCAHCYQDKYAGPELGFQQWLKVLDQYTDLLKSWRQGSGRRVRGHITVTGGEPFMRKEFLDLLKIFRDNRAYFSFAILTNGSFVDGDMARRLQMLEPRFVQVSVEGTPATHDQIRGAGNYDRTVAALRHMVKAGIRTFISFTAHGGNSREFKEVARLGRQLGVSRVWADRLIPSGSGLALTDQMLSPDETHEFFNMMQEARAEGRRRWFNRTEISMHRSLQFLVGGGRPYHCTAGDTLVTVQANGDLYPCRRMPIRVGNLMETPLGELYYGSGLFQKLRDSARISNGCQDCFYSKFCRGGLKCLSYAMTGDPFKADPGCWRAFERE